MKQDIAFPDGAILVEPSTCELAAKFSQDPKLTLSQRVRNYYKRLEKKHL
jgi:hypothetical protein